MYIFGFIIYGPNIVFSGLCEDEKFACMSFLVSFVVVTAFYCQISLWNILSFRGSDLMMLCFIYQYYVHVGFPIRSLSCSKPTLFLS